MFRSPDRNEAQLSEFSAVMKLTAVIPSLSSSLIDRSWYNRAGVERVMGFCTDEEHERFLRQVPLFEQMLVDDGISLIDPDFLFETHCSAVHYASPFRALIDRLACTNPTAAGLVLPSRIVG